MPEKEARPPAQNRHGGAPRGERVPLDARRASLGTARRAPKRATTEDLRLSALRSPLMGWMEKRKSKTRAQKCAAGTKKTALFDMVNRNDAATRPVPPSARLTASPRQRRGRARLRRRAGRCAAGACEAGDPVQHHLERVVDPGFGHEV